MSAEFPATTTVHIASDVTSEPVNTYETARPQTSVERRSRQKRLLITGGPDPVRHRLHGGAVLLRGAVIDMAPWHVAAIAIRVIAGLVKQMFIRPLLAHAHREVGRGEQHFVAAQCSHSRCQTRYVGWAAVPAGRSICAAISTLRGRPEAVLVATGVLKGPAEGVSPLLGADSIVVLAEDAFLRGPGQVSPELR